MKRISVLLSMILVVFFLLTNTSSNAQEQDSPFSVGADLYSNYIWRGTKFGTGPALQPYVEFSSGNFTIGSWGSFGLTDDEAAEADLYASYSFDFGLSIGATDYYYPGTPYFEYSDTTSSHAFEINLGYELGDLSIGANYILNDAHAGAGSAGNDMYFELGYNISNANLFIGAGDGWHTSDGEFGVCNLGIGTSKEIKVSESISFPISGQVILNPDTEQFYVVVGFSF